MSTPSLLNIPYLYKAGTLYSQIPESGAGDFTVTRATTPTANLSTRVNADGFIELVNNNVPRLDYPLGGAVNGCPALLVEPSATNLALRSNEFRTIAEGGPSNSWTANDTVIISVNNLSPDGTNNATRIRGATTPTNRARQQVITGTSGVAYVGSAWIRRVSGTSPITLRVGDAGSTTNISPTSTWQRFSFSSTPTTTTVRIGFVFPNDTDEFEIWGAQLETGSVATSYIPTTTAAITRGADVITKTGVSSLIGQSEGTIYAEVDYRNLLTVDQAIFLLFQDANNRFGFATYRSGSDNLLQLFCLTAGNVTVNINTIRTAGVYKLAGAYANNDWVFYINGTQIGTDTSSAVPTASTIYFGSNSAGANQFNNRIRSVAIYPNRLTNTQLQALTT